MYTIEAILPKDQTKLADKFAEVLAQRVIKSLSPYELEYLIQKMEEGMTG